jgi:hypothetical protein
MIFQSRYRQHTIVMRSATYEPIPGMQRSKLIPQIVATFTGPQRLFDSEQQQRQNVWSDEDRIAMEDWLFNHPKYMIDFFVAPGQDIPEEYQELSQRKAPLKARICEKFEIIDNDIIRCPEPVTAGRNFCKAHDGSEQQILKGEGGSGNVGLTTTTG